jgi:hypothetical protein
MEGQLRKFIDAAGERVLQGRFWTWINRSFFLFVLIIFARFLHFNWVSVRSVTGGMDPRLMIAAWGIFSVFVLTEAHINTILILGMNGATHVLQGMRVIVLSFLARYTPGKIWVLSLRLGFFPTIGVGVREVLSATVLENIFVLGTGSALYLFTMAFYREDFRVIFMAVSLATLFSMTLFPGPVLSIFDSIFLRLGYQPVRSRVSRIRAAGYTFYYLFAWLILGTGAWLLCRAMGLNIPGHHTPYVAAAYVGSMAIGFAAFFAPGGLGIREGFFAIALGRFTTLEEALYAALLARVVLSLAELSAFVITQLPFIFLKQKQNDRRQAWQTAGPRGDALEKDPNRFRFLGKVTAALRGLHTTSDRPR